MAENIIKHKIRIVLETLAIQYENETIEEFFDAVKKENVYHGLDVVSMEIIDELSS